MTAYGRKITTDELTHTLPLLALTRIRNDVLEACCDAAEDPDPTRLPVGVEFWVTDGILEALSQADHIEAGFDHAGSGTLLAEFEVGQAFHRCITCGQPNDVPSAWCGRRCRNLLRELGRRMLPGKPDAEALGQAEKWAACERNARIGWGLPLTREIAEALWLR